MHSRLKYACANIAVEREGGERYWEMRGRAKKVSLSFWNYEFIKYFLHINGKKSVSKRLSKFQWTSTN